MIFSRNKTIFSFIVLGAIAATLAFSPCNPARAAEAGFSTAQKDEIGAIVKDYINAHPEIVMDALTKHRDELAAQEEAAAAGKLETHMAFLTAADAPSAGNPKGDVTVIEFFDYNCGYCKRAVPDVVKAVEDDKNLRVVFHEMPILGPTSTTAAQWALAAHKQGKYYEFHKAVMQNNGPKDEESLAKIAKDLGLDVEKMKKDAASPEVQKMIDDSMAVARDLDINGTPGFIIGKTIVRGYMGPEGLQKAIADEREKAKQ